MPLTPGGCVKLMLKVFPLSTGCGNWNGGGDGGIQAEGVFDQVGQAGRIGVGCVGRVAAIRGRAEVSPPPILEVG